ncbi:MAG: DMT family transporter [Muribaculaceae bacterium]|nr:DMT family transporter [Muribaculaceae bacterium]
MKSTGRPVILASVAVLSWSTVATAFKVALQSMTTFEMLFIACATALIIFTIWMLVTGAWHELRLLTPTLWMRFAVLGLIAPVTYYLMLFKAYDLLPAQIAQPINYIWPILLAILIAFVERKPIPKTKYFGMIVSLGGVVLISLGGSAISGSISVAGIILAVVSAGLWGIYWMINDSLKHKVSEITALFLTFLFGMAYLFVGNFFEPIVHLEPESMLAGIYIGAFEMGIPYICFGIAIRETNNPALINQMCYLAPFLSLFFISIVLEEPILFSTYIGLALIIGGIIYNQYLAEKSLFRRRSLKL